MCLKLLKRKKENLKTEISLEMLKQNWRTLSKIKIFKPRLIFTVKNVTA